MVEAESELAKLIDPKRLRGGRSVWNLKDLSDCALAVTQLDEILRSPDGAQIFWPARGQDYDALFNALQAHLPSPAQTT